MAHVPALPGSPLYDASAGVQGAIDDVRRDLEILIDEGVDGVLFCNENDRPYLFEAPPVHIAAMARITSELAPDECPFGVDYLWDARAALGIAIACGAAFMREVLPGVYGATWAVAARRRRTAARPPRLRRRRRLRAHEHDARVRLGARHPLRRRARPLGGRLDAGRRHPRLGAMAGDEPAVDTVREVRRRSPAARR